jgi:hypothetical protein
VQTPVKLTTSRRFKSAKPLGSPRLGIGAPYTGRFGRAYKLHGLGSSNSQAFRRNIVLHSYFYVPEAETDPYPICNSLVCPMVSPGFLQQTKEGLTIGQQKLNNR